MKSNVLNSTIVLTPQNIIIWSNYFIYDAHNRLLAWLHSQICLSFYDYRHNLYGQRRTMYFSCFNLVLFGKFEACKCFQTNLWTNTSMTEHDFISLSVETKVQDKLQCGKLLVAPGFTITRSKNSQCRIKSNLNWLLYSTLHPL